MSATKLCCFDDDELVGTEVQIDKSTNCKKGSTPESMAKRNRAQSKEEDDGVDEWSVLDGTRYDKIL